ncbi:MULTISPECIES: serine hydrolase [unclassified Duganella]|uniref:serine hydrolase domain-containing protein n=1 Tax=unclassified Duganella TaxID=2636909 RepID=UPI00088821D2|nr:MULTISPECIES: serine hydrolase [unclassified Duganella]SDG44909.1 CubicO group peptidase, beta-lactamase class C family [Duganella sp. OV458]SDJ58992.1 CubicO group peptidase, beta-lactamase class C family [Duganella sp. OV510]
MASKIGLAALAVLLIAAGGVATLAVKPPELLKVGANYGAKIVCSNVFIAGRDGQAVLADDVQAPGHPVLKYLKASVDQQRKTVRTQFFGFVGDGMAVYRPGTGCATVPDGDVALASQYQFQPIPIWAPSPNVAWPTGSQAEANPAVQALLDQDALAGPGMRGMAVIHRGRLVAQRYGAGFAATTPLLGWSMTKTVTAALVGIQIADGKLSLQQSGFWPQDDDRAQITVAQLMSMTSGLRYNESYGDVSDVTRMLYLEPDMAAFTAAQPAEAAPGSKWSYSSGTSVLLSRIWQRAAGDAASTSTGILALPHNRLFAPLGMHSALIEADARGNLVGSSYMYANTLDWARFGQFLLQDGVWQGKRMLPAGFVDGMQQVAPASGGQYGQGQVWRQGPLGDTPGQLPADTYWLQGHDGQSIAVVPSQQLVVVRLGLTPRQLQYHPQMLLAAVIKAIPQ